MAEKELSSIAHPKKGLRNGNFEAIFSAYCSAANKKGEVPFIGVFPSDRLLSEAAKKIPEDKIFSLVVNIAPHNIAAGHFVFVTSVPNERRDGEKREERTALYLDPMGLPCALPEIRQFIGAHISKDAAVNVRQIQAMKSSFCSMYCLCFGLFLDRRPFPPGWKMKWYFETEEGRKMNEKLCMQYINRLIGERDK